MIWIGAAVVVLIFVYLLFFLENRRFQTTCTTCQHQKVISPFRIVQVSDLHDRRFGKDQSKLLSAIRDAKPDYIVITGDLFNRHNHSAYKNALILANKVQAIAPTYFIEGNHECSLKETGEKYIDAVSKAGVFVLRDAYTDLPHCRMIGLKQRSEPELLLSMLSKERLNIVLAHRAERFPIYAQTGADIILSGHAHGGQIRFGNRGVYAPQQGVFPKYTEGWYSIGQSRMFVSRGLGNTILFPRVFNTPELNVINFIPINEEEDESCL